MVVEPVYDATSDWVDDMGDGDGRMRDHSEAMTSALGGAALPFIMPGEGAVAQAVEAGLPELEISVGKVPDLAENISNALKSGRWHP